MTQPVKLITQSLIEDTLAAAKKSPRLRMNYNFHETFADNPHRFLNAICRGSYCPPHRHVTPPKSETFVVLTGVIAFLLFDCEGSVIGCHRLGENGLYGIDVEPGQYHSIVVLSEQAVCFEVKPGPYTPSADKDFAPWAPREGDSDAGTYLLRLTELAELSLS
jgi:cupin fold WbuC family metalloprotein